jgi:hypothetical protein
MAQRLPEFNDPRLILMERNYWQPSESRRPILLQAWYTEFASVLLDQLDHYFPGVINDVRIRNRGAHDIIKHVLLHFIPYLAKLCRANQDLAKKALVRVKQDRNVGTHQKIRNSGLLKNMFGHMVEFCDFSGIQGLQTFKRECEQELDQLNSNDYGQFY